jgi:hypothetical protein
MPNISGASFKKYRVLTLFVMIVGLLGAAPLFSSACRSATTVVITNNSSTLEFRHLYLAPDANNWGPDQLNGNVIGAGTTHTLNNMSCEGASTKIVVEDQNGCFLYQTVTCGENSSWTITNDAAPDCGN